MDDERIYAKTPRGVAEVAARGGGLTLAVRRVLIMVDGRRSVAELEPLLPAGEIERVVAQLEAQGYIQRVTETAAVPTLVQMLEPIDAQGPGEAIAVDSADESTLLTLEQARRRAVRLLTDRLGPDASTMSLLIEQSQSVEELRDRLREAERLVAGFLGEAAAQDFVRALRRG